MTEPRRIGELLAETLAAIRAAGPVLTKLDVSPQLYATLGRAHFAEQALHGYSAAPWLGVPVYVDRKLPPYARREHYSDGRVVTRYRLVMDPRVRQVAFQAVRADKSHTAVHGLTLVTRDGAIGRAWLPAVDALGRSLTSTWEGARSCAYLPGLKALAERTGLKLEPWQRERAAQALRAQLSYGHGVAMDPKLGKLGGTQL